MSTMRERRQWRAGDQKVDRIEMERFTALEVERVKRVVKKQEFVRFIAPFRDYSVQLVLRRIAYRIRWSDHGDWDSYNLDGLFVALRARMFLMLFDARSLVLKQLNECTGCGFLSDDDQILLKKCFESFLFVESKTDPAYHALVLLHCSNKTRTVPVSLLTDRSEGPRIVEDADLQMIGEACATTLPPDLRDIAIGANSCRVCERTSEQHLQICNGCKVVRYCGPECQRIDFSKHRLVCSRLFDLIGSYKGRRRQLENQVVGSETFRSIVTRRVDRPRYVAREFARSTRL